MAFSLSCSLKANEKILTMPIYKSCFKSVENMNSEYAKKYKGTELYFFAEIKEFDVFSDAHKAVVGYVTLTGRNLSMPIEYYANKIKMNCYPDSSVVIKNDKDALNRINSEIKRNRLRGVKESYVDFNEYEIKVFFHGKLDENIIIER